MRLIDADALMETIRACEYPLKSNYTSSTSRGMFTIGIQQVVDEQPTVAASQWHRVEDGLPRGQELVIVAVKDTAGDTPFWYTQCGWITTDGEYWIVDNEICDYVVAWMPLPELPEEGNK